MLQALCRLCSSAELVLHFEARGSVLDRCRACGFVQVRQQPTVEELRALYDGSYFAHGKYDRKLAQERETARRLELLARSAVPVGGRVLDAGCATGDFLAAGSARHEMWGLDISEHATREARGSHPQLASRIFTGLVEEQRFEPDFFHAIVLWDVIEHLWDPRAVLQRLVQHLKPGGTLLLSTPDVGARVARWMGTRWAFMTPPEHLGFFNEQTLQFLLERVLGLQQRSSEAHGKWANVGFLAYKLRRVFPAVPEQLVAAIQRSAFSRAALYVPTMDIRYVAARKGES